MINTNPVLARGKSLRLSPEKCIACSSNRGFDMTHEIALLPSKNKFYGVSENRRILFSLCFKCNSIYFENGHESGFPQGEELAKIVQAAIKAYSFKAEEAKLKAELKAISEQFDRAEKYLEIEATSEALNLITETLNSLKDIAVSPLHQERGIDLTCKVYEITNQIIARTELMRLLRLRESIFGPSSKEFAECLLRLGKAEMLTNKLTEAEGNFRQCLEIADNKSTPYQDLMSSAKEFLVKVLVKQKQAAKALEIS